MRGLASQPKCREHSGRVRLFRPPHQRLAHVTTALFFVTIYVVAVYALWIGIDFGTHWDDPAHYRTLLFAYRSEMFLPRYYVYPSMIYWMGAASVADKLLPILYSGFKPEIPFDFGFFVLRARFLSMLISSLGAWWIFLALRCSDLTRPALAAALGGSIYVLSWEFGYHARWIAPDLVTTQFVALFVFFVAKAERVENPGGWLTAAAVAAGLATATKYTAGGLVPALWLYTLLRGRDSGTALLLTIARQTAIAVGVYLVITPGTLVDPFYFARDVLFQMHHYATGHGAQYGTAPHDIHGFWRYLSGLWEYLILAMLSPQPIIAAALALASILGFLSGWRRSRPLTVTLAFLIVFYSIFFSRQVVFIVRNFLILLPIFAYFAGMGFDALIERVLKIPVGWTRRAAILATGMALAGALGYNAWQQVAFGRSIVDAQRQPLVRQVAEYLARHSSVRVALSPSLAADLISTGEPLPANVTEPSRASEFIFRASELSRDDHLTSWPATEHDTFDWIGPREVNLNYYSVWCGADHAFILNMGAAERMGVVAVLSQARTAPPRKGNWCPSPAP